MRLLSSKGAVLLVLGSQIVLIVSDWPNTRRETGIVAHLIDGPQDIDLAWFTNVDSVLITAGASAPETVVDATISVLKDQFQATVESHSIREEEVYFPLPKELRILLVSSTLFSRLQISLYRRRTTRSQGATCFLQTRSSPNLGKLHKLGLKNYKQGSATDSCCNPTTSMKTECWTIQKCMATELLIE